jgi:hypothetical protein
MAILHHFVQTLAKSITRKMSVSTFYYEIHQTALPLDQVGLQN